MTFLQHVEMLQLRQQYVELIRRLDALYAPLHEAQFVHGAQRALVPQIAFADANHLELGAPHPALALAPLPQPVHRLGVQDHVEVKRAPAFLIPRHIDLAPHVLHQLLADDQADAAAPELARGGGVPLAEELEQPVLGVLREPNACVRYLEEHPHGLVPSVVLCLPLRHGDVGRGEQEGGGQDGVGRDLWGLLHGLHTHRHRARPRELARVRQQVRQHLAEASDISVDDAGNVQVAIPHHLLIRVLGVVALEVHAHVHALVEIEGLVLKLEHLRFRVVDV
mmetsp:Transcript_2808/g.4728  ORF Transcript_2808/g.4728 Transcript_2808/m.4728 type:complete len:280 (+) Transcript_2808:890-1729(+)